MKKQCQYYYIYHFSKARTPSFNKIVFSHIPRNVIIVFSHIQCVTFMYVLCLGLGVPFYSGFLYVWASLLLFWTICLAWAGYCTNTISLNRNTVRIPKVSRTLGTLLRDDVFGRCDRSDVLFLLLFPDIVTAVSFFYSTITYSKCYVHR